MGNSSADAGVLEVTGKIMVVAIMLIFFVVVFVFSLHLYARWFWQRRRETTTTTTTRRHRLDFAAGHQEITVARRGLDLCVLKTIPVVLFDPKVFDDMLECSVCLCEVSEGEKTRLLPKCNHGFHVECIDMWFQSHSTCPLCRNPVSNQTQANSVSESTLEAPRMEDNSGVSSGYPTEAPGFPTNVLFWGDETQVSTFGPCVEGDNQDTAIAEPSSSSLSSMASTSNRPEGKLVIDIPRENNEEDEQKSPIPTRLRSLKRLLSGNRRLNPFSPRNMDIEQGGRGQS